VTIPADPILLRRPDAAVLREAVLAAAAAAAVSALLVWTAPPGIDLAAHVYQRTLFLQHGLTFWNNFWYAGRYSFVTYSLLYYPLAALLGINALAVSTVAAASLAFSAIAWRQWGPAARWSSRAFSVVWAGTVLLAMFPFALGAAFALLALWAAQARHLRRMAVLSLLSLAASPVAFLLLVVVLAAIAAGRRVERRFLIGAGLALGALSLGELVLWRMFPSSGRYPFATGELLAALAFCAGGTVLTWRNERARAIRYLFPAYAAACMAAYVVPSALGENIDRLRFLAVPLALLILSLRDWRPRAVSVVALTLAVLWNITPLATSFAHAQSDPASQASYWTPAIRYLQNHRVPDYRVEAVDTVGHWEAVYLPQAGIPLARGWFRQDDFPENAVLYGRLGPRAYTAWLRRLGVGYVVLSGAPPDYSARAEEKLIEGGRVPLRLVSATTNIRIYAVRAPRPLITGPGRPHVVKLGNNFLTVTVPRAGTYRIAVNASPYWRATSGCVNEGKDGMIRLHANSARRIRLTFAFSTAAALDTVTGRSASTCGTGR
jgi:hypothetical protein